MKKLPDEVLDMTLPEYFALCKYWRRMPPEHETLAMLAEVYTTWAPERPPMTEAEAQAAHRKSLEDRWRAGAMNIKQMYEATGGFVGRGVRGTPQPGVRGNPPGIGPFPGAH